MPSFRDQIKKTGKDIDKLQKEMSKVFPSSTWVGTAKKIVRNELAIMREKVNPNQAERLIIKVTKALGGAVKSVKDLLKGLQKVMAEMFPSRTWVGTLVKVIRNEIAMRDDLKKAAEELIADQFPEIDRDKLARAEQKLRDRYQQKFRKAAEDLRMARLTPDQFEQKMIELIRQLQPAAALLGAGGVLSQNQQLLVEKAIREQLNYLQGFMSDIRKRIAEGKGISGREIARAGMYAGTARTTAEQSLRQRMLDAAETTDTELFEVRRTTPAEHCTDCVRMRDTPAPVGTLPPIGESQCGGNCKCYFEYGGYDELVAGASSG